MSKQWGGKGIGSWAEETEREEAEQLASAAEPLRTFPSLQQAVTTTKPKKKKMSLSEFYADPKGLTPDEMLRLPTAPKESTGEEMQYGRGFSNSNSNVNSHVNVNNSNRRMYYGGGFDDSRKVGPTQTRVMDFKTPSGADGSDSWGFGKKPVNRYGSLGGGIGAGGGFSRADEVDNWGVGKKPIFINSSNSTFRSGFRDSGGSETDRWSSGGSFRDQVQFGENVVVNESVEVKKSGNPIGAARPREEVLSQKGLDWKKMDLEIEAKRPTSSHSSRPSSAQSGRSKGVAEGVAKTKAKVNPFGEAKPREVLLEEKGLDWRKIDLELEHRRVDRPQTEEEKILKAEIEHLKHLEKDSLIKGNSESMQGSGENPQSLRNVISQKERDLEILIRQLDDKIRFGQKAVERPGSGAGRPASFPDRPSSRSGSYEGSRSFPEKPPSQSGSFEGSRRVEFTERHRSRGTTDGWTRPGDDNRRAFRGGRERGFFGNRDTDRPREGERW